MTIPVRYDKGSNWEFAFVRHGNKLIMTYF